MNTQMTIPAADTLLEHSGFLRGLARSLLRDDQAADDVVQETFTKALRGVPHQGNLRAWLATVVRNLAINRLRSRSRRDRRERVAARRESLPSVEEGIARLEVQRDVVEAVLALDEPYRSAIVHRFFYELEPKEVAAQLGVPAETIRTRIRRGLERLRTGLDKRYGGERRSWAVALLPVAWPAKPAAAGGALWAAATVKLAAGILLLVGLGWLVAHWATDDSLPPRATEAAADTEENAVASDEEPTETPNEALAIIDRDLDLHGVVVDGEGEPVPGARIEAIRYSYMRAHEFTTKAFEAVPGPETRSDADGRFRLRLARGAEVAVRVRAPGFAPVDRRACQAGAFVRIALREGLRVPIQVVGPAGEPLEDALVFVQGRGDDIVESSDFFYGLRGRTGPGGRFVPGPLLAAPERTVIVMHREFAANMISIEELSESITDDTIIALEEGEVVRGIVVEQETGRPIEGVRLSAFAVPFGKTVVTGPDGRFEYKGWSLEGSMGGSLYALPEDHARVSLPAEPGSDLRFELERGIDLAGQLIDQQGAPIVGAYVSAVYGDDMEKQGQIDVRETRSDADGRFVLKALRSDLPHTLIVLAEGFGKTLLDLPDLPESHDLGRLAIPTGRRIEGRVVNADGEPVEGLYVFLTGANADRNRLLVGSTRPRLAIAAAEPYAGVEDHYESNPTDAGDSESRQTDDLGRFRFCDLSPGKYTVGVSTNDGRHVRRRVELGDEDVLDIEFRQTTGRKLVLRVEDTSGEPVAKAYISCMALKAGREADSDGRAEFTAPDSKQQILFTVHPPEGAPLLSRDRVAGKPDSDGVLHIVLPAASIVSGRLLGPDGNPIPGGQIEIVSSESFETAATAQEDGRFSAQVPSGTDVRVEFDGSTSEGWRPLATDPVSVPAGTRDLVLRARTLAHDRTLIVRVADPDGNPLEGLGIAAYPALTPADRQPITDADGIVKLEGLPDTTLSVTLFGVIPDGIAERWALPKLLSVTPAGQTVELRWRKTEPITGTVLLPDGKPARTGIAAAIGDRQFAATARTDAQGRFRLLVPAGEHREVSLVVDPAAYSNDPAVTELKPVQIDHVAPGTTGIEIRLEPME